MISLDALPKVHATVFKLKENGLFVIIEGEERQIVESQLIGNATHDLCVYLNAKGKLEVGEISKVPEDKIVMKPMHDLWIIKYNEPIGNNLYALFEICDGLREVVNEAIRVFGGQIGKEFEMYGEVCYGKRE